MILNVTFLQLAFKKNQYYALEIHPFIHRRYNSSSFILEICLKLATIFYYVLLATVHH